MHKKYAKDGLVILAVSLDEDAHNPDVQAKVRQILEKKKAPFPGLILDEPVEVWSAKLRFTAVPALYVFDRQGKWHLFKEAPLDDAAIEKRVVALLQAR